MNEKLMQGTEAIGLFCRLYMNNKRELPIRPSEMGILIFVQKQNMPVTPLNISQFFNMAKPSVTTKLNVLLTAGYLEKKASETDGRSYTVQITSKGAALVTETFDAYYKTIELLWIQMGESAFNQLVQSIELANDVLKEVK